jgi:hypothetical protein
MTMSNIANENRNLFCDFELILSLHVILPLLDYVHTLICTILPICVLFYWCNENLTIQVLPILQ